MNNSSNLGEKFTGHFNKIFIMVVTIINMTGLGLAWPIIPKLIQQFEGGNISNAAFFYGLLSAGFALSQFFFQPLMGALSDQYGRRPILIITLIGNALHYLAIVLAPSLVCLVAIRMIGGIFNATTSVTYAYMSDISTSQDRARNFGWIGAAFGIGFIAGPLIGGFLGEIDLKLPFLVAGCICLLNAFVGILLIPETLSAHKRKKVSYSYISPLSALFRVGHYPLIISLFVALLLANTAQRGLEAIWMLYTDFRFDWDVKAASISLAFIGLMFVIVQGFLVGKVVRRFSELHVAAGGFMMSAFSLSFHSLITEGWMVYPLMAIYVLGYALAVPAITSLCSQSVSESEQGLMQGTIAALNSVAVIIGPFVATMVLSLTTLPSTPTYLHGAWIIMASILFLVSSAIIRRLIKKRGA